MNASTSFDTNSIPQKLIVSIQIYKNIIDKKFSTYHDRVFGQLEATAENCRLVSLAETEGVVYPNSNFNKPQGGLFFEIEIQPPRDLNIFFAKNLDDLLSIDFSHQAPPDFLYLSDLDVLHHKGIQPQCPAISHYLQTLELINLLRQISDYETITHGWPTFILLNKEKFEIVAKFKQSDLKPIDDFKKISELLKEETHQDQRKSILKNIIIDKIKDLEKNDKFPQIINRFDDIIKRFYENYKLYVAEFSLDKIYSEANEKRIEYIGKLNKTFSDIQNQLLAIPITLILVGTQFDNASKFTVKNTLVWMGSVIFSIIIMFLLKNQYDTTKAIKLEIDLQKKNLTSKYPSVSDHFINIYSELEKRATQQRNILLIIFIIISAALAGTTLLYLWYSGKFPWFYPFLKSHF